MFDNITRAQFSVDLVIPAIQTASAFVITQACGRLGHYSVSSQSTILLGFTASLLSGLANNFFSKQAYQYIAIPVSVAAGLVAHSFFYQGKQLHQSAYLKEIAIVTAVLLAVRAIANNWQRFTAEAKKVEAEVKNAATKAEVAALNVAEGAADAVAKGATAVANQAAAVAKDAQAEKAKVNG